MDPFCRTDGSWSVINSEARQPGGSGSDERTDPPPKAIRVFINGQIPGTTVRPLRIHYKGVGDEYLTVFQNAVNGYWYSLCIPKGYIIDYIQYGDPAIPAENVVLGSVQLSYTHKDA